MFGTGFYHNIVNTLWIRRKLLYTSSIYSYIYLFMLLPFIKLSMYRSLLSVSSCYTFLFFYLPHKPSLSYITIHFSIQTYENTSKSL